MTSSFFAQTSHTSRLVAGAAAIAAGTALVLTGPANAATGLGQPSIGPAAPTASLAPGPSVDRGSLVSLAWIRSLSPSQAASLVTEDNFNPTGIRNGVDLYRLVYRTIDPRGRRTTASGLLGVPRSSTVAIRPVVFLHGSEVYRGDAPSVSADPWALSPAVIFAGAGYAAIAPDYLGLGLGPGPHPWLDVPSEVTASVDMLRASRTAVAQLGRSIRSDVFVTGFSQGGSGALGLARAIDQHRADGFRLGAVAPISGAYQMRNEEIPALLGGDLDPNWSVAYTAYLLVAWNRLHHIYGSPTEVFQAPYDRTIEALFDSDHTGQQVFAGLPARLDKLLTPHAVRLLEHPTGGLAAALALSDSTCTDWAPRAPLRLYVSDTDEQVVPGNTEDCQAAFESAGAAASVVSLGSLAHLDTNRVGTGAVLRWFNSLR
jgi:hypothetical protein